MYKSICANMHSTCATLPGPTFIKPDQPDPWIKDQIKSLSSQQFRPYSYEILYHVGSTSPPTWHKILQL